MEQAIFRLSESVDAAPVMFEVMRHLNFEARVRFAYTPMENFPSRSSQSLDELVKFFTHPATGGVWSNQRIRAELRIADPLALAELVSEALTQIEWPDDKSVLWQDFDFSSGRHQYARLQSLTLLRRLNILRLSSCRILPFDEPEIDVANASSGQQQMLCSIIGLATALRDNSLVLIDEPELSLHPQWQQSYLDYLLAALKPFSGCHVLVATHSPLIVQQAQAANIGVARIGEGDTEHPRASEMPSVEATLVDVFETPVPNSQHLAHELLISIDKAEDGEIQKDEAVRNLIRLRKIYSHPQSGDAESISLINDALDLINTSDDDGDQQERQDA
ncbi:AAA family ATPase [Achromobacter spanius]|uniref:AAA family ATPase n=1 Tax=Achromobacter spanius TaxID=217203 RepID=UPI00320907E5